MRAGFICHDITEFRVNMKEWKLLVAVLMVAYCLGLLLFPWIIQSLVPIACRYSQNFRVPYTDHSNSHTPSSAGSAGSDVLILHYVRLYANRALEVPLKFLDCLAAYSAIKNLQPAIIFLHTNSPTPFPFEKCETLLNVTITWPPVRTIIVPLEFVMKGQHIQYIAHEADIRKLKAVEMYGGIVLDFDVFVINGSSLRESLRKSQCIICHEDQYGFMMANAGLLGCHKRHARFPQLVLKESYRDNYNAKEWFYNSAMLPWDILQRNNDTATVLDGPCNHVKGNWSRNFGSGNWTSLPAYHTYIHDNQATKESVWEQEDTLGTIARWLLPDSSHSTK